MEVISPRSEDDRIFMERVMAGNYYWNTNEMSPVHKFVKDVGWFTHEHLGRNLFAKGVWAALVNVPQYLALVTDRLIHQNDYQERNRRRCAISSKRKKMIMAK